MNNTKNDKQNQLTLHGHFQDAEASHALKSQVWECWRHKLLLAGIARQTTAWIIFRVFFDLSYLNRRDVVKTATELANDKFTLKALGRAPSRRAIGLALKRLESAGFISRSTEFSEAGRKMATRISVLWANSGYAQRDAQPDAQRDAQRDAQSAPGYAQRDAQSDGAPIRDNLTLDGWPSLSDPSKAIGDTQDDSDTVFPSKELIETVSEASGMDQNAKFAPRSPDQAESSQMIHETAKVDSGANFDPEWDVLQKGLDQRRRQLNCGVGSDV